MDGASDTVLFFDVTCPKPYDPETLKGSCQGGTESTMTRLAEGLASLGQFNVVIEQHNRVDDYQGKALYTSPGKTEKAKWVVVLRDPRPMVELRKRFPLSKIYLYSHDLADRNLGLLYADGVFKKAGCLANICVSDWHRTQTIDTLRAYGFKGEFKIRKIYNPLAEEAVPTKELYDRNKLVWLSSPHKGLHRAYELFGGLLRLNPNFRLYVTNPGYCETLYTDNPAIRERTVVLGSIPHKEALAHIRNALCLFYPNTVFPETFGMVLSESNASGTPVLSHPIGAVREVLDSAPGQVVDCRDDEKVFRRIMEWYEGARPIVMGRPQFKLHRVVQEWVRLLQDIR